MLSAKRVGLLSGIGMAIAASSWLGGCGTGNNFVPQAPIAGNVGGYAASCPYGQSTYPLSNGYGYGYNCYAGYVFNGSTCVCSSYYNNGGYGYGYGYNNGYGGTTIMCNGQYVYSNTGYCPPGTVPGH